MEIIDVQNNKEYIITTIKEIARRAGVSIGTVDRVIHKRGRVAKKTEQKVRRIIEELDYTPNIFAKHLKLSKTYNFGVLMPKPTQDSNYWTLPINGITKAHAELESQRIAVKYYFYDKYSSSSFNKVSQEILDADLDGLVIAPVLSVVFDPFIKHIPSHLPYVFFDSLIPDARYISYIGQDSFQSGILAGRLMHILMRNAGVVALIKLLPEDYHINDRVAGFKSYCEKCPNIELIPYILDAGQNPGQRSRLFNKILDENKNLIGIFVTNATTHQIAEHIKTYCPNRNIHIIGYDLIEDNVRLLKEGFIDFLISQQSEKQGYEALYALYRHVILKRQIEKKTFMQIDIVARENIDYYKS